MAGENGKIGAKSASIWGICAKLAQAPIILVQHPRPSLPQCPRAAM